MRITRPLRFALLSALVVVPIGLAASAITLPHLFSNGAMADASQVNANFTTLAGGVNANDARITAIEQRLPPGTGVAAVGATPPASPTEGTVFFDTTVRQLRVYSGGQWQTVFAPPAPARSCLDVKQYQGVTASTTYYVDPDGIGPAPSISVFCDMTTDSGGWTEVFRATVDNYNSTGISYIPGTAGADSIISRSSEMMFAFVNTSTNALTQAWKFPTPAALHSTSPMEGGQCGYVTINATRLADGTTATKKLRYGWGSFGSTCDDGCSSTWGMICLKSSDTNGTAGGFSDFPLFATYATTGSDHCSASNQTYTTTACSTARRFAIFVR